MEIIVGVLFVDVLVFVEVAYRSHIPLLHVFELLRYREKPPLFYCQRLEYLILHKCQPLPYSQVLLAVKMPVRGYVKPFTRLALQR